MSIASLILSSVASQAGAVGGKPSHRQQAGQDFEQLFQALQSGNLPGAQQAYSDLQQLRSASASGASSTAGVSDGTSPITTTPSTAAGPVSADWSTLGQALDSGSLPAAQGALGRLKQDVATQWQSEMRNARAIYALMSGSAAGAPSTTAAGSAGNTVQNDLANLQAALQTGDTAGAQKLLAQLEQDLQSSGQAGQTRHHHHYHGGFASRDSASAYAAPTAPATMGTASAATTATGTSTAGTAAVG